MSAHLDTLPDGSDVLIDANIFVYGLTDKSPQCKNFLTRVSNEQVFGITLFEVVNEATHVFMLGEAQVKKLFTATDKARKFLQKHPEEVTKLTEYWTNTQRLLALNLILLSCEENIIVGAQKVRTERGLLTNDSIIVATMREYEISNIATNDGGFALVNGLSVFSPTDL